MTSVDPAGALCQVAMCTADLPGTARIYTEVFGFANSGGRLVWGEPLARVQQLPTGARSSCIVWWMVGRQEFAQLELFTHTVPSQRSRKPGWTPASLGWTRLGIAVPDFDATVTRLGRAGLPTITAPVKANGLRRVCFKEPGADVVVEIMEEGPAFPGGVRAQYFTLTPAIAYVALSVSDLDHPRRVFSGAFGFEEWAPDTLHQAEHESLWGLPGARRACAVFRCGDVFVEACQYESPMPAGVEPDRLLSDQGLMNAAIGFRKKADMALALNAATAAGATASNGVPDLAGAAFLRLPDDLSLELVVIPRELDPQYGFRPQPDSQRLALVWPTEIDTSMMGRLAVNVRSP